MAFTKEQLKTVTQAKEAKLTAQTQLWNLRLQAAVDTGDGKAVMERIGASVEDDINNCGCNVQCGALQEGPGALVNPGGLVRR
ncbi:hypothetical protein FIU97_11510 [Roseivivax sp. THAF40]|uniref:hypothetical protein n=1 Tax=unclassified Roseivivax TaxID=2639302 RepID=UPI001268378E|nr:MULTISPECIES: hypothetical protein [unclassified Roseivivax]QFS83457.1 hypothetical protein FIV09_11520 [Roseivivax sp. THAF197b]QFT47202.1 hypothetical protein FIU97_11510 [Roseivivax sp. THAF40]